MRFITMTIFAVTGPLVALATAKPVPNQKSGGIAIPLTRHPSSLDSNRSIDLDAIASHALSVREKILVGLENYQVNTGTTHPFAVKRRSESSLGNRGVSVPLTRTAYQSLDIWTAEISIGTPPKTLNVRIDTGAADMWVLQTGCDGISLNRNFWDPHSSESSENQGQSFLFGYGDGSIVQGDRYTDTVTIAGFTSDLQTFGSATSYISGLQNNGYADGLLGLAFPYISNFDADPLFESLVKQNRLINPMFSFKFSSSGAEMYIGGANTMLYNGDITYTPVTSPGYWLVSTDDVRVNGNPVLRNVPAIFDTGASLIFGDWERVSELYRGLDATLSRHIGVGFYYLPCDSFPTVSLTFGSKTFEILPEALRLRPIAQDSPYCFSAIVAVHWPFGFWTIGKTFLQGVYSVFDYETQRVGLAELA